MSIRAVFAEDHPPVGLARVSVFDGSIERVINPSRDGVATFHGLPSGATHAVVRVNGAFAGQQELTIPDVGSLEASVQANSAIARNHVHRSTLLRFVQCNIFYSGKGTDPYRDMLERLKRPLEPWEPEPIQHLAHNLKNFENLALIGMQEIVDADQVHKKDQDIGAVRQAIQEHHISGQSFGYRQRPMGLKPLTSGTAVLWRRDLIKVVKAATFTLHKIEKYWLRASGGLFAVKAPGSGRHFGFFTCKLRWPEGTPEDHRWARKKEARTLVAKVSSFLRRHGFPRAPVILCMDMNDEPGTSPYQVFRDAGYVPAGKKASAPANAPDKCIDFIWYRHAGGLGHGIIGEEHVSENFGSDHLFKWVDISI